MRVLAGGDARLEQDRPPRSATGGARCGALMGCGWPRSLGAVVRELGVGNVHALGARAPRRARPACGWRPRRRRKAPPSLGRQRPASPEARGSPRTNARSRRGRAAAAQRGARTSSVRSSRSPSSFARSCRRAFWTATASWLERADEETLLALAVGPRPRLEDAERADHLVVDDQRNEEDTADAGLAPT